MHRGKSLIVGRSYGISSATHIVKKIRSHLRSYRALRAMGLHGDIQKALRLVFGSDGGFLRPLQRPAEISALLAVFSERKTATIVEEEAASDEDLSQFARVDSERLFFCQGCEPTDVQ